MTTPTTDTKLLLAHRDWLRRLAYQLIQDPAAADDLVQETWLTAIQRRRSPAAPIRPWLAGVLRNKALSRMRAQRRRVRRESEAAGTEAQDMEPGRALEAVEVGQQLTERVLALSPPLRDTIVLRYYHDHSTSTIAQELGVTESTVRTRLARALEQLRGDLDADCGGRERWCSALSAFALAEKTARTASALAPVAWLATGLLTASVAVSLTLNHWDDPDFLQTLPQSDAPLVAVAEAEPDIAVPEVEPGIAAPADTADKQRAAVGALPSVINKAPPAAEEIGDEDAIDVTVVGPSGKPMAGVLVQTYRVLGNRLVTPRDFSSSSLPITDGRGKARILDVPMGLVRVAGYMPDWAIAVSSPVHITATRPSAEMQLVMTRGGSVKGELMGVRGEPAVGIRLFISLSAWPDQVKRGLTNCLKTTQTGANGAFRFDHLLPGDYSLRTSAKGDDKLRVPDQMVDVEVLEGQTTRVVFENVQRSNVRRSYVELSGLVLRDGEPLAGATLNISSAGRIDRRTHKAETDAEGHFEVTLDEGGDYRFQISDRPLRGSVFQTVTVPPSTVHELVIAFSTGQISGRVLAYDGQPVVGIIVNARGRSDQEATDQEATGSAVRMATTNAAGEYVFERLLAATYTVGAGRDSSPSGARGPRRGEVTQDPHLGSGEISGVRLEPGEFLSGVDLQLSAAAAINGVVSDEQGNPLASAEVQVVHPEHRSHHSWSRGETDNEGHFQINGVVPGDYRVRATWGGYISPWVPLSVGASETAYADLITQPGTMVTIEVQDGGGPAERCYVRIEDAEGLCVEFSIAKNGATTLGPLFPGTYRVTAHNGGDEQECVEEISTTGEPAQTVLMALR